MVMRVERRSSFVLVQDMDGLRHAVRPGSVSGLHDADPSQMETIIQLGSRAFVVPAPLDTLVELFDNSGEP